MDTIEYFNYFLDLVSMDRFLHKSLLKPKFSYIPTISISPRDEGFPCLQPKNICGSSYSSKARGSYRVPSFRGRNAHARMDFGFYRPGSCSWLQENSSSCGLMGCSDFFVFRGSVVFVFCSLKHIVEAFPWFWFFAG